MFTENLAHVNLQYCTHILGRAHPLSGITIPTIPPRREVKIWGEADGEISHHHAHPATLPTQSQRLKVPNHHTQPTHPKSILQVLHRASLAPCRGIPRVRRAEFTEGIILLIKLAPELCPVSSLA